MVGIAAAAAVGLLSGGSGTRAATPAGSGLTGSERITSFAGQAKFGLGDFAGDGGPASRASLSQPQGVTVDAAGNVYIADTRNQRVRRVSATGTITTIAGGGRGFSNGQTSGPALDAHLDHPTSVAVDRAGNVYIASSPHVYRVSPGGTLTYYAGANALELGDGGPATAARLDPNQLAIDREGNLIIADARNHRVRKVTLNGTITTIAGTGRSGHSGDGGQATAAQLNTPRGVAVDARGNVYVGEQYGGYVRKVDASGTITTIAGSTRRDVESESIPAIRASLNNPFGVAVDASGNVYVNDYSARVRKISPTGTITTVVGPAGERLHRTFPNPGDGGPAILAILSHPVGMAFDRQGNLLIADSAHAAIRKVWAGTNAGGASAGATLSAGRWSGTITQSNLRSPFQLTLTLAAPPLTRPGRVEIPSAGCVGTVRYLRTDASGRYVYAVTWQRGRCAAGTIWLRLLTGNALSYRWEDGRGVFSVGTLRPGSAPTATGTGSTATRQLRTFADRIERILIQSAAGRRSLATALTAGFNCSITTRAAGDAVNRVVANRQSLLRQVAALRAPTPQAANALALLRQGLQHSVDADIRYRDGFYSLGTTGCPLPPSRSFALARQSDTKASTAKRRFVAAYNPLAKRVGRRTWSANEI